MTSSQQLSKNALIREIIREAEEKIKHATDHNVMLRLTAGSRPAVQEAMRHIVDQFAAVWKADATKIMGPDTSWRHAVMRFILYAKLQEEGYEQEVIAEFFERDHAGIVYGLGKFRDHKQNGDALFLEYYKQVQKSFK